jgi:hypothetical protein
MRIFIEDHNSSPDRTIDHALEVLREARVFSVRGGGVLNGSRAIILIHEADQLPKAIAALTKAGLRVGLD